MKRGFLLDKSKAKKALPNTLNQPGPGPAGRPLDQLSEAELKFLLGNIPVQLLECGKVKDTSLPTDFTPDWNVSIDAARGIVTTGFSSAVLITVPPKGSKAAVDEHDHSEWFTIEDTKPRVLSAPGFPKRVPKLLASRGPAYEVRVTQTMGMGVFATRDIGLGELVFAERPLLVMPKNLNVLGLKIPDGVKYQRFLLREVEIILEAAVSRMTPENQEAYRALMNNHTEDGSGPLTGIMRTNGYGIDCIFDGPGSEAAHYAFRYTVIGKVGSRINHSCFTNVRMDFDIASFSLQFRAERNIKAGEQLFYAYCSRTASVATRQRLLAPYGIVCACQGCTSATPERDLFREQYVTRIDAFLNQMVHANQMGDQAWPSSKDLRALLEFQATALREGLHTGASYAHLLIILQFAYARLGMRVKHGETLALFEKYKELYNITFG